MNVHLRKLAARQADIIAAWQLRRDGWTWSAIRHRAETEAWRVVHQGVYALTQAPLSRHQLWMAATLTAPATVLSHASAGACWGFRPMEMSFETVTRSGTGGPKRFGGVLVMRSTALDGDTTRHDGIAITTAERTMIDLASGVSEKATRRMFREALRLRVTSVKGMRTTLEHHRGRPGTPLLLDLATRYATLPYNRTRSDAEALALEVLQDAGVEPPQVNVRIAREEADLVWPDRRLIVEIDGPQYHRFPDEDARKQRLWEKAGYTVRRIGSDVVYDDAAALVAVASC